QAVGAVQQAAGGELLDALVAGVGHEDVAVLVDRDAVGPVELAVAAARVAELRDEAAVAVEALDAVVAGVDHVDVAVAVVHGHVGRAAELAGGRTAVVAELEHGRATAAVVLLDRAAGAGGA